MQCACNETNGLVLCTTITDTIFIDGEGLSEEFVGKFFKVALIGYLTAGDEKTETEFRRGRGDAGVESGEDLVLETIEG